MPENKSFSRTVTDSSIDFGKRHWVAGVITMIMSSIIPLVTQWHSDDTVSKTVADAEKRCMDAVAAQKADDIREQAAMKADFDRQIDALWRRFSDNRQVDTSAKGNRAVTVPMILNSKP